MCSWYMAATEDKMIPPDAKPLMANYGKRAGSIVFKVQVCATGVDFWNIEQAQRRCSGRHDPSLYGLAKEFAPITPTHGPPRRTSPSPTSLKASSVPTSPTLRARKPESP